MKPSVKLFDYLFVLRPTLLFPVWTVFLGGYSAQLRFGFGSELIKVNFLLTYDYIVVGFLLTLCMGATFIINQLSDTQSDRYNNKLFLIANGEIQRNTAILETLLLAGPVILIGFILKFPIGIALLCCFIIAGILYSCKPFLCKDRPLAGFFCNGAGALVVFITGWLVKGVVETAMWLHALPFIFALWSLYFFTTLPDITGDKKSGKITVGVKYGVKNCITFALLFNLFTIGSAFLVKDFVIFIPALATLPFFIVAVLRGKITDSVRTTKIGLLFVSLAYCYKFPGFLILLLFVFFSCKWYYKNRFGLVYPNFETQ